MTKINPYFKDKIGLQAKTPAAASDSENKSKVVINPYFRKQPDKSDAIRQTIEYLQNKPEQPKATSGSEPVKIGTASMRQDIGQQMFPYTTGFRDASAQLQEKANSMPSYMQGERTPAVKLEKAFVDVVEGQQKVDQMKAKADAVQQTGAKLEQTARELASAKMGLNGLYAQYQQTGDETLGKAYLMAAEEYNKKAEVYRKEYAAYEKTTGAIADYNSALMDLQLKYTAYEQAERTYKQENPNLGEGIEKNQPDTVSENRQRRNAAQWAFDQVAAGAGMFNKGIAQTAKLLAEVPMEIEEILTGERAFTYTMLEPILKWADWVVKTADSVKANADAELDQYGTGGKVAGTLVQGVTGALPSSVLAMLSGGTSVAGQISAQITGMVETARQAVLQMAKNPMYWSSVLQTLGNSYEEALEGGATQGEALVAAVLTSFANSAIEVGGGMEKLPQELRDANLTNGKRAWEWVKSSLEEGGEELIQNPLERLVNKVLTGSNVPLVSVTDRDAVVNPFVSAQEFAGGAAVGAILGGGQTLADMAINPYRPAKQTETTNDAVEKMQEAYQRFRETGSEADAQAVVEASRELQDAARNGQAVEDLEKTKEDTAPFKTGAVENGEPGGEVSSREIINENIDDVNADVEEGIRWAGNTPEIDAERIAENERTEQQTVGQSGNEGRDAGGNNGYAQPIPRREYNRATGRRADEARRIQANVHALGGKLTSLAELGYSRGTSAREQIIVEREAFTREVEEAWEIAESEGLEAVFLLNNMKATADDGTIVPISAAIENGKLYVRADSLKQSVRESVLHEIFHKKKQQDPTLVKRLKKKIQETYSKEETREMFTRYAKLYQNEFANLKDEKLVEAIWEEMLADAYAEFQRYSDTFGTAAWSETVQDEVWNGGGERDAEGGTGTKFSVAELEGENKKYGLGVILDTDIFEGVKIRDWGKVLGNYVYNNLAGQEMTMYDAQGNPETVHIAKQTDRVKKDGTKNNHKVLDELARYRGDNVKALATVHLSELLATSGNETTTNDKSHGWLDENGWRKRTFYAMTRNGKIYEGTLNIADGRNGLTVYKISAVHQVDTKKEGTPAAQVPASEEAARSTSRDPYGDRVAEKREGVNTKFSLDRETTARERAERNLAQGLAEIMSVPRNQVKALREGSVREMMEAYQQTGEIDQEKLENAISTAYEQGLSIDYSFYEEYKQVKDYIRTTAVVLSEQDRVNIPDFNQFRKKAMGTLRLVNQNGIPADVMYQELMEMAPGLFSDNITHPADQVMRMFEVAKQIKKVETPLRKAMGENADEFYNWAYARMEKLVERELEKYAESVAWKAPQKNNNQQTKETGARTTEYAPVEPDTYDRANEKMERFGQAVLEQVLNKTEEPLTGKERALRGNMRDWIQYVLGGEMTPEEFAETMREAKAKTPEGTVAELVERIENRGDNGHLFRPDDMTDEEYAALDAQWNARQQRTGGKAGLTPVEELVIPKTSFTSTPAMDKLGIKIDGSVARYRQTEQLRAYEKAAKEAQRMLKRRISALNPSDQDKFLARGLVDGNITLNALDDEKVDVNTITELADYMMAAKSFSEDMIAQRRNEINTANYRIAEELFKDSDAYNPKLRLAGLTKIVMNERTPERVVKQIFGQEQGKKIYETYFRPVWVNGAEMNRFENRMLDRVAKFEDRTGTKRVMTEAERAMAQRLMEGEAARDNVARLDQDTRERVEAAAKNVNNGEEFVDAVREFGLAEEYHQGLVQAYADYLDTVAMSADMDQTILKNAITTYQQIYNEMYDAINDFLVSHGYSEIGFIKGYAPHFQKREAQQGLFGALKALGVEKESVSELPASIAGRTADFKPNMKWNPHMQSRKGSSTSYDIQEGFAQYLHYAAEMFYHTDDVMRVRQAVNWFRGQYAGETISEAIEDAQVDRYKSTEWKKEFLEKHDLIDPAGQYEARAINKLYDEYVSDLFEKAKPENLQKYSEFVTWLDNYANIVAGKQSLADRGLEYGGGRNALNAGSKLMRRFSAANVAGNLSSVLNQSAQLPLIQQRLGAYLERAIFDMARGGIAKDNFVERSDFLTDKRGVDKLTMDNGEKFISALFKPAELMDRLVSTAAVRGRYLQALHEGMDAEQALREADDFGRRVMGSRMKGAKPLGFESKTFVNQMLHVFQVEAANTFDYMLLSDMPQEMQEIAKTKGKAAAARHAAGYVVGYLLNAFLLNRLTDELYGGSPAPFDLMGWALNFAASGFGRTDEEFLKMLIDNAWEQLFGERPFETERLRDEDGGIKWAGDTAMNDLSYNVLNDVPYVRNAMGMMGLGDRTLPTVGINEFAENVGSAGKTLWDQIWNGEEETGISWAGAARSIGEDLLNAATLIMPAGRQIKKTMQGGAAVMQGGRYSGDRMQYPVERSIQNAIQAMLFGPSVLDEADEYYSEGKSSLTAGQTQKVLELEELGIDRMVTYDLYQQFREINKELSGSEASTAKRNAINNLQLRDQEKLEVYSQFVLDTASENYSKNREQFQAMLDAGLTWDDVTQAHNVYTMLNEDEELNGTAKATEFAKWVDQQGWDEEQRTTVEEKFKFWMQMPAQAANYEEFEGAGVSAEHAADLAGILDGLEPEDGKETVSLNQKVLAINGSKISDEEKVSAIAALVPDKRERLVEAGVSDRSARDMAAELALAEAENGDEELTYMDKLRVMAPQATSDREMLAAASTVLQESTYEKVELADRYGVPVEQWIQYREKWTDMYGSDSASQEKVETVLDRMMLTDKEKAVLWQIANKSWKPANNPYDTGIGEEIYWQMNEE